MKKTIRFYLLLYQEDMEYLSQNNFRELPVKEISSTYSLEGIENFAVNMMNYKDEPLITVKVVCDFERYKEYKDSQQDEEEYINEFGDFTKIAVETINYSVVDKIKILNIFGKKLSELDNNIYDILDNENSFFKSRLKQFLHSNSREIIPYNYFERPIVEKQDSENLTDEQIKRQIEEVLEQQERVLKKAKERTVTINSVEEAVDFLINEDLDQTELDEIKNKSLVTRFDGCGEHFGYNMYLRNVFIYPNKNEIFLENLRNYDSHYITDRGEFGEGIIEDLLWRKLNNCETTHDNNKKIEKIQKQIESDLEDVAYWNLIIKMKLLSYNLDEEKIELYLDLENRKESDEDNFYEYYYQQKALLARLNKEDRETFENIKQDYFKIQNVVKKLKLKS